MEQTSAQKDPKAKKLKKLTAMQLAFANEYLINRGNATKAAIKAGYSAITAAEAGSDNLRKPHIKAYIDDRLKGLVLSADEVLKYTTDIAKTDLNGYFVIQKVVRRAKVVISLPEYIERKQDAIKRLEYTYNIASAEGLLGEKDDERHEATLRALRYEIVQLETKLVFEPDATVIVDGPEELVEVAELDLARLVKDKEAGRIKSIKHTEFGPTVELYPADVALRDLGKYHGLYKDKMEHSGPDGAPLPPAQIVVNIGNTGVPFARNEDQVR